MKTRMGNDQEERESLTNSYRKENKPKFSANQEFERQSKDIEELGQHVSAISEMGGQIHNLVVESAKEIDEIQERMDRTQMVLENVTTRTNKMVKAAGGPRYCFVISMLSALAFVLFLLLIYT